MKNTLVAHVGGFFIRANNPKILADWYATHLGMHHETWGDSQVYYISFPYLDTDGKSQYFAWSIMPFKEPIAHKPNVFTINLRVNNLSDVVVHLQNLAVKVSAIEEHEEGKFAWCKDAEGNQIELWEAS